MAAARRTPPAALQAHTPGRDYWVPPTLQLPTRRPLQPRTTMVRCYTFYTPTTPLRQGFLLLYGPGHSPPQPFAFWIQRSLFQHLPGITYAALDRPAAADGCILVRLLATSLV